LHVPPKAVKEDPMRQSLLGAVIGAGLVIAMTADRGSSEPAGGPLLSSSPFGASGALITHVTAAEGHEQMVTVIDPQLRVMAVYRVDRSTGKITPTSIRNFTWDLQMIEYNSGNPLPQDIRSGLQR
jgi:hypothetical protein